MKPAERMENFNQAMDTLEGECMKSLAEFSLHSLAKHALGRKALELASGGERIEDERLNCDVAGLQFENPLIVGAGWDKKGRAVDGLYTLGFAGTEVGSVLVHPQSGEARPRLFIDKDTKSVGLNRFGFNSQGVDGVETDLAQQNRFGITGINIGKNKLTPDKHAPWAHAAVAERLYDYADYFVINPSSPNTPGLRGLLNREPLGDIITAVQEVSPDKPPKPLLVKTTIDLSMEDLDTVLDVCLEKGVDGVIDTNTTIEEYIKAKYGWQGEKGGVSGNDADYRKKATQRMKYITRQTAGTGLQRIGVGGINDADTALERIQAGAQLVQVVTAIRQHKGRVARNINQGLLNRMEHDGVNHISEYVATAA